MAEDGDKNRKRRRVDKKDSNDDGGLLSVIFLFSNKLNYKIITFFISNWLFIGVFSGVIDLTTQSKANSFKIHDVVDLTAPVAPKPVSQIENKLLSSDPYYFKSCEVG